MTFDPILTTTLSDLSVNISAGYFGSAFITQSVSHKPFAQRLGLLTTLLANGTIWLLLAYALRSMI